MKKMSLAVVALSLMVFSGSAWAAGHKSDKYKVNVTTITAGVLASNIVGTVSPSVLPSSVAYTGASNAFTKPQSVSGMWFKGAFSSTALQSLTPDTTGELALNTTLPALCLSTGTPSGSWALSYSTAPYLPCQ